MRHRLSQAFHNQLVKIGQLHDKKQSDYGRDDDPFANVRASEDFGIDGWVGALIRMNDKMRRLQKAATGKQLVNESIEDSFLDIACYAVIALVLYQEGQGKYQENKEKLHDRDGWTPGAEQPTNPRAIRKGLFP